MSSSVKSSSNLAVPVKVREVSAAEAAQARQSNPDAVNFDAIEVIPESPSPTTAEANVVVDADEENIPRTYAEWKTFCLTVDGEDLVSVILICIVVFVMCAVTFITGFAHEKTGPVNYAVVYTIVTSAPILLAMLTGVLLYVIFKLRKYLRMRQRVGTALPRTVVYAPRRQPDPTLSSSKATPTSADTGTTSGTTPSGTTSAASTYI